MRGVRSNRITHGTYLESKTCKLLVILVIRVTAYGIHRNILISRDVPRRPWCRPTRNECGGKGGSKKWW